MMLSAAAAGSVSPRSGAACAQQLPDLLGEERHHRVQQPQQRVERVGQHALGRRPRGRVLQAGL